MGKTLDDKLASRSPELRTESATPTAESIAEEKSLGELRCARGVTQRILAQKLGMDQNYISKLEFRSDLMLSTLRDYIEAMGGRLDLVAKFPDSPPVCLRGFNKQKGGVLAASSEPTAPGAS